MTEQLVEKKTHVAFDIPGEAVPWARPRAAKNARHFFTKPEVTNYKALVKMKAQQAMGTSPPMEGAVAVTIQVFRSIPETFSGKKRKLAIEGVIRPTTKPDLDNVIKGIFDALNKLAFKDDNQVCQLVTAKFYDERPRVEVEIHVIT